MKGDRIRVAGDDGRRPIEYFACNRCKVIDARPEGPCGKCGGPRVKLKEATGKEA